MMSKVIQKYATAMLGDNQSLKKQLMVTYLLVGLVPLILLGLITLWVSSNMVSSQVNQNIKSIKANKVVAIENYANTIVNQVITASASPDLAVNLQALTQAYDGLLANKTFENEVNKQAHIHKLRQELSRYYSQEFLPQYRASNNGDSVDVDSLLNALNDEAVILQHAYIEANPAALGSKHEMFRSNLNLAYDDIHQLIHKSLKIYLEKFGYYDIFLVDQQGRVVYSVYKELDYATNLLTGAYANSGLGQAFKAAQLLEATNDYALIDYAQYQPSYQAPASFIASPIEINGQRIGSLVFQMPLDAITSVMSEQKGLGETGESYLVGKDKLMRSDSIKFPKQFSVDASFRNSRKVDNEAVIKGLSGKDGMIEVENYLNQSVLSGFVPVKFGSLDWVLIAEIETEEAFATVTNLKWITFIISLVATICIVIVARRVSTGIVKPVVGMQTTMAEISKTADFTKRVNIESENEIGQSVTSLNSLLANVEASLDETNSVVSAMANGDFSQRVKSDFTGSLLILKQGVNGSASSIEKAIQSVNDVVACMAQGNFEKTVDIELKGDLHSLKQGVNDSTQAIAKAIKAIGDALDAMSKGDFKYRSNATLVGAYKELANDVDDAMSSVDSALTDIDGVMEKVANGDLNAYVDGQLPGQLAVIKDHINDSLSVINNVFSETEQAMADIAEGNLTVKIEAHFPGRMEVLKTNTNATVEKLNEVVKEIRQSAEMVSASADDIAKSNVSLSHRTEEQASNLQNTAASMDQITTTVANTAKNANHANKIATEAKIHASKGGEVVNEAVIAMEQINDASNKISDIISVIDAIAFQTNLLALNAAVEAARAGEQGRGFAVVAGEVRNLAGRSANAAKQINELISDSVKKVTSGSELVTRSGKTLQEIIQQVENVSSIVGEISSATEEQSLGINEVHTAVETLQELTQQNTAMVEEASAASEELGTQAKSMTNLMGFFR